MALVASEWVGALRQVVRLDSEKIWVPIVEVREIKPTLYELVYNPAYLRQGVQQGGREIRLDDTVVRAGVSEKQGEWSGIVEAAFPDVGRIVIRKRSGRPPSARDQILIAPNSYLQGLLDWLDEQTLPRDLESAWQQRTRQRGLPCPAPSHSGLLLRAAQAAAQQVTGSPLGIVWGPPGTGKTTTLAEMVAALVSAGERVLVLAPTRIAADGACLAIDAAITRARLSRARGDVLRTDLPVSAERFEAQNPDLLIWSDEDRSYQALLPQLQRQSVELRARVLIEQGVERDEALARAATVTDTIEKLRFLWGLRQEALVQDASVVVGTVRQGLNRNWASAFRHLFVDEASMVPLSDGTALLLQQNAGAGRSMLLFGDPMQLGPVPPRSQTAGDDAPDGAGAAPNVPAPVMRQWFEESLLRYVNARAAAWQVPVSFLNEQSRMCPPLCEVVSAMSYGGRLVPTKDAPSEGLPGLLPTAIGLLDPFVQPAFLARQSLPRELTPPRFRNGSSFNTASAEATAKLARHLAQRGHSVIVCSPFRAQAGMLFRALGDLSNVIAGTVHRVQGQEADVAIYDPAAPTARFVREQPMAGILLNVAASRAKRAFVISAEPAALAANPLFEPFIRVATPLR
jgi:Cdc6-like AAA superfamily ATPase